MRLNGGGSTHSSNDERNGFSRKVGWPSPSLSSTPPPLRTASQCSLPTLTLRVPEGQLWMIVGPVGCGKSSLLSAILGEMQLMDGELSSGRDAPSAQQQQQQQEEEGTVRKPLARKRRIAYTAQTSWLESATIRENILFGRRFDATRYKQAVHVAALEPDLARFVDGDGTVVGENGLNLSGSVAQACIT